MSRSYSNPDPGGNDRDSSETNRPSNDSPQTLSRRGMMAGAAAALGLPALIGRASAQSGNDPGAGCRWQADQDANGYGLFSAEGTAYIDGDASNFEVPSGQTGVAVNANGELVAKQPDGSTTPIGGGSSTTLWTESDSDGLLEPQSGYSGADVQTLEADSLYTDARATRTVIRDRSGTYIADGPDGEIDRGSDIGAVINSVVSQYKSELPTRPGDIQLPRGSLEANTPIEIHEGVAYRGRSIQSTEIKRADGMDDDLMKYEGSSSGDEFFPLITDLTLKGNRANNSIGHGLYCNNPNSGKPKDLRVRGLYVDRFNGDCIHCEFGWGYRIHNCTLERGNHGIYLGGNATQCHVTGLYVADNDARGAYLDGAGNCYVHGIASLNGENGIDDGGQKNRGVVNTNENGWSGFKSRGVDGVWQIQAYNNAQSGSFYDVDLNNGVGYRCVGNYAAAGIRIGSTNTWNGHGLNSGDPSSTGNWNGNGEEGIVVYDTSVARPYTEYQYIDGAWQSA